MIKVVEDTKFFYIRNAAGHPVACVAYDVLPNAKKTLWGLSVCARMDNFSRAVGRELAYARLRTQPFVTEFVETPTGAIRLNLLESRNRPTALRDALRGR
jgi:hypothetical protein